MIENFPYANGPVDESVFGKLGRIGGTITGLGERAMRGVRRRSRVTKRLVTENTFSFLAVGCVDAACFTHSVFSGLLVTGIMFVILEWKASDESDQRSE